MKKPELVWIKWLDAYVTQSDDMELDDVDKHCTISIGWEVKKDKEFVYLSHFFDGIGGEFASPYTAVPKGMIKEKYTLEIKESKRRKK